MSAAAPEPTGADGRAALGPGRRMECGRCGTRFGEDRGQPACRSCPLADGCRYVRCPACGYENPVTPGWVEALLSLWPGRGREEER